MSSKVPLYLCNAALTAAAIWGSSAVAQESAGMSNAPKPGQKVIAAAGKPLYVSPMLSGVFPDTKSAQQSGMGVNLGIGTAVTDWLALELSGFLYRQKPEEVQIGSEMHTAGYGANALVFPFSGPKTSNIYGLFGAHFVEHHDAPNQTTIPNSSKYYNGIAYNAGAGLMLGTQMFGVPASFRMEALYRLETHDDNDVGKGTSKPFGNTVVNIGVLVPLFWSEPPPPPEEPAPAPEVTPVADADGDGVLDDADQCPDTPAGTPVDATGCPLPPPEAPKPACKTPEPNETVDLSGCATGDVIVLRGVTFDFDTSRLTANAKVILDQVVTALAAAPQIKLEVGGHTDSKGSDDYNQRLSEKRAISVQKYLVSKGVAADRLSTAGYGETKPIADNETDEGRELNRRVELTIKG